MNKIIFGLVGTFAAGKGTVATYFKKNHGAVGYRFSDSLRDALDIFGLENSRENLQGISTVLRERFGENLLARAMAKRVQETDDQLIIIDGVRRLTDIENLRSIPGFALIKITADPKLRHQRYVKRNENAGDDQLTYEQFLEKQNEEADKQIPEVMQTADLTIDNNGTFEQLYEQVEAILKKINAASGKN